MLADREDVRRQLPDFFIVHHTAPCRHAQAALLPAIGNRLKDALGVKLASREIDAALSVRSMAMGALLCQEKFVARRNRFRILEIRAVVLGMSDAAHEDACGRRHRKHESTHYASHSPKTFEERRRVRRPSLLAATTSEA